jgi:plasmid maintenance system antidote protein VapI
MSAITPAHLRAKIAEKNVSKYVVAAFVRINPATLSALLNERRPLDQRTAERILRAIGEAK